MFWSEWIYVRLWANKFERRGSPLKKHLSSLLFLLFAAFALAGCRTVVVRERPAVVRFRSSAALDVTPLVEALLDVKGTTVQSVEGAWQDRTFAAEVVMKGDGERTTIVFLAPQLRLATVTLTRPHALRFERAPQIPRSFEPEYLVADLAFINLPTDALRRVAGMGLSVVDDGTVRRIALPDDTPLAELTRSAAGELRYRNLVYGYDYVLKNIGD